MVGCEVWEPGRFAIADRQNGRNEIHHIGSHSRVPINESYKHIITMRQYVQFSVDSRGAAAVTIPSVRQGIEAHAIILAHRTPLRRLSQKLEA